ncbi:VOC family protein [Brevibacterium sp. FAM 24638]|uniref:VOC family protein n=1 Tax=Brevibacterium sp. FAM 24638 TaxID=3415681 RepID=UPI003C7A8798
MISLDHIAVWTNNMIASTISISEQTGLKSAVGGYFPGLGLGQMLVSLGDHVYLEVESIVDHAMATQPTEAAQLLTKQTTKGACFSGLCFRTDSKAELEQFAAQVNSPIYDQIQGGKVRAVTFQDSGPTYHAPDFRHAWLLGKPNLYYVPTLENHSSSVPAQEGTGNNTAKRVLELEVGGSEDDMRAWFGDVLDLNSLDFNFTYNGGPDGLYTVTIDTDSGIKQLRMNPINL